MKQHHRVLHSNFVPVTTPLTLNFRQLCIPVLAALCICLFVPTSVTAVAYKVRCTKCMFTQNQAADPREFWKLSIPSYLPRPTYCIEIQGPIIPYTGPLSGATYDSGLYLSGYQVRVCMADYHAKGVTLDAHFSDTVANREVTARLYRGHKKFQPNLTPKRQFTNDMNLYDVSPQITKFDFADLANKGATGMNASTSDGYIPFGVIFNKPDISTPLQECQEFLQNNLIIESFFTARRASDIDRRLSFSISTVNLKSTAAVTTSPATFFWLNTYNDYFAIVDSKKNPPSTLPTLTGFNSTVLNGDLTKFLGGTYFNYPSEPTFNFTFMNPVFTKNVYGDAHQDNLCLLDTPICGQRETHRCLFAQQNHYAPCDGCYCDAQHPSGTCGHFNYCGLQAGKPFTEWVKWVDFLGKIDPLFPTPAGFDANLDFNYCGYETYHKIGYLHADPYVFWDRQTVGSICAPDTENVGTPGNPFPNNPAFGTTCPYQCNSTGTVEQTSCLRNGFCDCKPGWGGLLCEYQLKLRFDQLNTTCEEFNPCEGRGVCQTISLDGGYYAAICTCFPGFAGSMRRSDWDNYVKLVILGSMYQGYVDELYNSWLNVYYNEFLCEHNTETGDHTIDPNILYNLLATRQCAIYVNGSQANADQNYANVDGSMVPMMSPVVCMDHRNQTNTAGYPYHDIYFGGDGCRPCPHCQHGTCYTDQAVIASYFDPANDPSLQRWFNAPGARKCKCDYNYEHSLCETQSCPMASNSKLACSADDKHGLCDTTGNAQFSVTHPGDSQPTTFARNCTCANGYGGLSGACDVQLCDAANIYNTTTNMSLNSICGFGTCLPNAYTNNPHLATNGTCVCKPGYRLDADGLCLTQTCPLVVPGNVATECNGLTQQNGCDTLKHPACDNVCNRQTLKCNCYANFTFTNRNAFVGVDCSLRMAASCSPNKTSQNPQELLCGGSLQGLCTPCKDPISVDPRLCPDGTGDDYLHQPPTCQCVGTATESKKFPFCGGSKCQKDHSYADACKATDNNLTVLDTGDCVEQCRSGSGQSYSTHCSSKESNKETIYNCQCKIYANTGWIGPGCDIPVPECTNTTSLKVCNGNPLWCHIDDRQCHCPFPYQGRYCETVNYCNNCNLETSTCVCVNQTTSFCNSTNDHKCSCQPFFAGPTCDISLCDQTGGAYNSTSKSCTCPANATAEPYFGCRLMCPVAIERTVDGSSTEKDECGVRTLKGTWCNQIIPANTNKTSLELQTELVCNCSRYYNGHHYTNSGSVCRRRCLHCQDNSNYISGTPSPMCIQDVCDADSARDTVCQYYGPFCDQPRCLNEGVFDGIGCGCPNILLDKAENCSVWHCENGTLLTNFTVSEYQCVCDNMFKQNPKFQAYGVQHGEPYCISQCIHGEVAFSNLTVPPMAYCACKPAFNGTYCDRSMCVHSKPESDGEMCLCEAPQWGGVLCNQSMCVNGGEPLPVTQQGCVCPPALSGDSLCHFHVCGDHGVPANDSQTCVCDPGWVSSSYFLNQSTVSGVSQFCNNQSTQSPLACVYDKCCPGYAIPCTESDADACNSDSNTHDYYCVCPENGVFNATDGTCSDSGCSFHGKPQYNPQTHAYRCLCDRGYNGTRCDSLMCDIDPHSDLIYLPLEGLFVCECAKPWTAINDSSACDEWQESCGLLGDVAAGPPIRIGVNWQCDCMDGYVFNPTLSPMCSHHCVYANTQNQVNGECVCLNGFTGDSCQQASSLSSSSTKLPWYAYFSIAIGVVITACVVVYIVYYRKLHQYESLQT